MTCLKYSAMLLLACWSGLLSCKKFVDLPAPETKALGETIFTSDQLATSAMIGLYTKMVQANNTLLNGSITIFPSLSADDITGKSINDNSFSNNALTSDMSSVINFWTTGYNYIYTANAILQGLQGSSQVSGTLKNQLTGEARFVRALTYFYLTGLYGDVPLVLSTKFEENAVLPRTPVNQVMQQVIADLKEAAALLPEAYPTTSAYPFARVRPNRFAALALLSRTYLYQQDWANAEVQATTVIQSGLYSLAGNLNTVFLSNSKEAIWQLMPVSFYNTSEGLLFNAASPAIVPNYTLRQELVNSFEPGDARKAAWIKTNTVNGQEYPYPYKYKVQSGGAPYSEYNMVLRLAEQFLIRAEARAKQNNVPGAQADLNSIRNRAGLPNTIATDQGMLLAAVEHERQVEYFAEWGHRWFDLKRTGRADAVLGAVKGANWQPADKLYPIPLIELQRNPTLTQNVGY